MQDVYLMAKPLRVAIFDVDGVLTDGGLHYGERGEETKVFDVRDGHGIKMLQASGVAVAIITSRTSGSVARRAENLGIDHLFQGVENKLHAFRALTAKLAVKPESCSYMGDDWVDLPVMTRCGVAFTVPEAPAVVRQRAHYVTQARAGHGAVREVCELIMQAQGTFETQLAGFLT